MLTRIGQQLGNYRLISLLGTGGFAEVYLGEHVHLESQAAIKVLRTALSEEHQAAFLTEARRLVRLRHPHIVRLLDFGIEGETPFLVMDYAPNGSLRTRHPKGSQVDLETVVVYVKQVADALQYIHDQKLVHRDVKPENMLLGANDEVLLSDLGVAAVAYTTESIVPQRQAGTPPYMAPEQIQHAPRPQSDQYALGIVVYEWLCGTCPFQGSALSIMMQHLNTSPPALRTHLPMISASVEHVVLTALAKDPKQRFARVQDFAAALEQAYQATRLLSVDSSSPQRSSSFSTSSLPGPTPLPPKADDLSHDLESAVYPKASKEEPFASSPIVERSTPPLVSAQEASPVKWPAPFPADPQRTPPAPMVKEGGSRSVEKQRPDLKPTSLTRASKVYSPLQGVHPLPRYRSMPPSVKQPLSAVRTRFITSAVIALLGLFALIGVSVCAVLIHPQSPVGNGGATPTAGTPSYTDPLNNPNTAATLAAQWDQSSNCAFQQDGYHVTVGTSVLGNGKLRGCLERGHQYTNFALSVDLTIISGHTGGVFFRVGTKTLGAYSGYLFEVGNQGYYKISRSGNFSTGDGNETLIESTSSALKTGTNAKNTLQILTGTNSLSFYVNNVFLATWNDTTFTTGDLAFFASTVKGGANADMLYSNLKVYPLS